MFMFMVLVSIMMLWQLMIFLDIHNHLKKKNDIV